MNTNVKKDTPYENELKAAISLGKMIAPYCIFGNFLDTKDPEKRLFCKAARRYVQKHPNTALSKALTYEGPLYRLSADEVTRTTEGTIVSWAATGWMFEEWEGHPEFLRITSRTRPGDFAIDVCGLARYLKNAGEDIYDIERWTGVSPKSYFAEHPHAECIAPAWENEDEVLYPLYHEDLRSEQYGSKYI